MGKVEPGRGTEIEARMVALAGRQHGVVARRQLGELGLTSRMVARRVEVGALRHMHRGVYLLGALDGPLRPRLAPEMAAVLACGDGARVSHRSAGWLWGFWPGRPPRGPDVAVPWETRRARAGVTVHRTRSLASSDRTTVEGIPVTTPARTLRDLATVASPRVLNRAAARAERLGLVDAETIAALLAAHGARPGVATLRAALGDGRSLVLTRSEAEELLLALLRRFGLPTPETNVRIAGYEVDCFWPALGVAVEVDGFAHHGSRRSFDDDRRRDAELAAAGVQVIRVTWTHLTKEPERTMMRLGQVLALAGSPVQTPGIAVSPLPRAASPRSRRGARTLRTGRAGTR